MMKPDIGGEATSKRICRAFRGGWGQRAGTDQLRNLGDPAGRGRVSRPQRPEGTHNQGIGSGRESERLIVARKRVTTVERRGLTGSIAAVRGKENRLDENPITEEGEHIEALKKQASGDGLPDKLSLLRQKLSQKAKQEPQFRFLSRAE